MKILYYGAPKSNKIPITYLPTFLHACLPIYLRFYQNIVYKEEGTNWVTD